MEQNMAKKLVRRAIGRTACNVSVLGMGGAPLGNLFEVLSDADALATVEAAYEAGIGLFDMAPQYGNGVAEHRFGHVLRDMDRDSFVLSTKVGRLLRPTAPEGLKKGGFKRTLNFNIVHDYTYDAVMRSVEDSYQRLGMHRIDIALIHDVDVAHHGDNYDAKFKEAIEGAVPALQALRKAGIIKAIGIGVNEVGPSVQFAKNANLDCYMLAGRYTLLHQDGLTDLFPLAEAQGFSFLIAGPFNSGILATGATPGATHNYRPPAPEISARVEKLSEICRSFDTPLAAAAIQFPLGQPRVASVVTGAVKASEIAQNVDLMAREVPADLWVELRNQGLLDERAPVPVGPFAR
jgi:D-threo-aldose 1-dehydrogenase